jgi:hypothetical protein
MQYLNVSKATIFIQLAKMFKSDTSKKSLKIPKGKSESVYRRRTDNTMAK